MPISKHQNSICSQVHARCLLAHSCVLCGQGLPCVCGLERAAALALSAAGYSSSTVLASASEAPYRR